MRLSSSLFSIRKVLLSRAASRSANGFRGLSDSVLFLGVGMVPGIYRFQNGLWSNENSAMPTHISRSKGRPSLTVKQPRRRQRRWHGQRHGPAAVFVNRKKVLLFRPSHSVERLWTSRRVDPSFLAMVRELTSELPAPKLISRCGGRSLVAGWIDGEPISGAEPTQQIAATREILDAIIRINRRTARPEPNGFIEQVISLGQRGPEGLTFCRIAADERLHALTGTPFTLQHGEPTGNNVLIQSDGSPVIIDWDPATVGFRPFWADASRVASIHGHGPLLSGEFDHELACLWRSVGLEPPPVSELRSIVALGSVLYLAMVGLTSDINGRVIRLRDGYPPEQISKSFKVKAAWERLSVISP